jgi:hypothetical protein
MGLCRGNVGNLMQHWTLAETLAELRNQFDEESHLLFVTSHSMAPWSVPRKLVRTTSTETRRPFEGAATAARR